LSEHIPLEDLTQQPLVRDQPWEVSSSTYCIHERRSVKGAALYWSDKELWRCTGYFIVVLCTLDQLQLSTAQQIIIFGVLQRYSPPLSTACDTLRLVDQQTSMLQALVLDELMPGLHSSA
jgi:hypothetical protein